MPRSRVSSSGETRLAACAATRATPFFCPRTNRTPFFAYYADKCLMSMGRCSDLGFALVEASISRG